MSKTSQTKKTKQTKSTSEASQTSNIIINNNKVDSIFSIFQNNNPKPKTELNYTNNYTLLVAVVLSAQSTDIGVNKATKKLFEIADSPEKMLKIGFDKLTKFISSIGLYNSKAKNIISLSEDIITKHNSKVPDNFDDLVNLAGVGVKTAKVVLNVAFSQKVIAVDTHIMRVSNRLGLCSSNSANKVSEQLEKIIPDKYKLNAHHWLILHGRYVCKARNPLCRDCDIFEYCNYYKSDIS